MLSPIMPYREWVVILTGLLLGLTAIPVEMTNLDAAVEPPQPPPYFKLYVETIPGSKVTFDMMPIPGGIFTMGSPDSEEGHSPDEGPQHAVVVRSFWMGKTEVTWDEYDLYWQRYVPAKPLQPLTPRDKEADAVTRPTAPYADETFGHGREGHPVLAITHHAAMEYCRWLSAKTGKTYRLPTEAEWEYACRAGSRTAYSFGNDPSKLAEYAWFKENSEEQTHKVAQKRPNAWGLYDMHGNVAEWCLDHYQRDFYEEAPPGKPVLWPVRLPTASRYPHVARGGAWSHDTAKLRSAARRASEPRWNRFDPMVPQSIWWLSDGELVGFRVVRPVIEQDNLKGLMSKVTPQSK
jgi:formylglycine-generating enzyme required for sulfatase activity